MAITRSAVSSQRTSAGTGTSLSWSHNVGTGENRILVVGIHVLYSAAGTPTVSYAGQAMTLLNKIRKANLSSEGWVYLFYRIAPASGSNTIAASWTNQSWAFGGGASFNGVSQVAPMHANITRAGSSGSPPVTYSINSPDGGVVVDVLATYPCNSPQTPSAGQTLNYAIGVSAPQYYIASSYKAGNGSVSMGWSWTALGANYYGMVAGSLNPIEAEPPPVGLGEDRAMIIGL